MWRNLFYVYLFIIIGAISIGCQKAGHPKGYLSVYSEETLTRTTLVDSSDFIVQIRNDKGKLVFNDKYGRLPVNYSLDEGKYTVLCLSRSSFTPNFDAPIYGDEKIVVIKGGEKTSVVMQCTMMSCGIRLRLNPSFLEKYPSHIIQIEGEGGRLVYPFRETRPAYFNPGRVTVYVRNGDKSERLFSRVLNKREVLDIGLTFSLTNASSNLFAIQLDTSKFWIKDNYGAVKEKGGNNRLSSYSVSEAVKNVGKSGVWVYGYIVGCVKISNLQTSEPFTMPSNIAIAIRNSVEDKEDCIVVELKKQSIKSKLNLVDNPNLIGRKVFLKGDIVDSYYGTVGLKKVVEYKLD